MIPSNVNLFAQAGQVFQPSAPVSQKTMFVGRISQISSAVSAVTEVGRHVIVFGERGVGKTSFANNISQILPEVWPVSCVVSRVNAVQGDSFESLMHRSLSDVVFLQEDSTVGIHSDTTRRAETVAATLETVSDGRKGVSYDDVLRHLRQHQDTVLILDEFDRLQEGERARFTDLIKALSDFSSRATLMLVGVADSVVSLMDAHESLGRNLVQVEMPRMTDAELREILAKADEIDVAFDSDVVDQIVRFAQGIPHFAHLLGFNCIQRCAERETMRVTGDILEAAIASALPDTAASIRNAYQQATSSAHAAALYPQVLLACAMAVENMEEPFGAFRPSHVLPHFREIMDDPSKEISTFNNHLSSFCEEDRGSVLERLGSERNYRFRFRDPMMPPYVLMVSQERGLLPQD